MRVGIDISQVVYEGTGSARYVDRLIKGLVEYRNSFDLTLFGSALQKRALLEAYKKLPVATKFFPFPPRFFEVLWNQVHTAPFEQFAGKVDVYHSSDWTQAPSRAKKVTTVHDLIPFLFPEYVHPRIRKAHTERWKWIVKEVDHVIVDAECTRRDIIEMFHYPQDQITVVPLGIEQRFIEKGMQQGGETDVEVLAKYGVVPGSYILAVGTLEPRKNMARLLESFSLIDPELRKHYTLLIVGKKAWADTLSIPDGVNVLFTGYVEDAELPSLYAQAKLFVMPSLYEGFGFPVVEAMATRTPVLAAKISSLPEVGGESILYFKDIRDSEMMAKDLQLSLREYPTQFVDLAYQRARLMTWRRTIEQTIAIYEKITG